jgi:hypothetical protein
MLRRSLQAVLVVVALASLVEDSHAATAQHHAAAVVDYLFGGYGYGPLGHGDFSYVGYAPSRTVYRHGEMVPSFTTRIPYSR